MTGPMRARVTRWKRGAAALDPTVKGMLWTSAAGVVFCLLNALMRLMAIQLDAFQTQFLRYFFGVVVMWPLVMRSGMAAYRPKRIGGQFARGAVHTIGLMLWFTALPKTPLADMTALGFTTPIFIMIGAYLFFHEAMRWDRWVSVLIGFAGVLVVVAPKFSGSGGVYHLIMLASAPMFAASFLLTKALTRYERTEVIVLWHAITVTIFSFPLALLHWAWPTPLQWFVFLICGILGSAGHYCLTRSFSAADISSTQTVKFLDLVWASFMGWLVFADVPSESTLVGGVVIAASTLWIARREAQSRASKRG
jgi:drug/metabolite transporter (DMT)-like permease